jgi:kynureninase
MTVDRTEAAALALDAQPDRASRRSLFRIPHAESGPYPEVAYLAGNSLGLQPKATREELLEDFDAWADLAVHGHMESTRPWMPYHAELTEPAARLVGALPEEVVVMNSLTVNLHLLMASFYRPTATRYRIVVEDYCFSSDSYAVRSHAAFRGYDPDEAIIRLRPRPGEDTLRTEDVVARLRADGPSIALILLGGVNYLTGELMDIPAITEVGHEVGAMVGWDLAHAAGNVTLSLHDWNVDFAAWCSYKYLNSGPGSLAGAFIHARHVVDPSIPRLEGWWSTREETRFAMNPVSDPPPTADAWAMSNPPIFAMGPVRTSLAIFDEVGMEALRTRSLALSDYLWTLLEPLQSRGAIAIVTPREHRHRGTQISVRVPGDVAALTDRLRIESGVIADERKPDIVRLAPAPLYCTYHDCWRAADALARALVGTSISEVSA